MYRDYKNDDCIDMSNEEYLRVRETHHFCSNCLTLTQKTNRECCDCRNYDRMALVGADSNPFAYRE